MNLSDAKIKNLKPKEATYKVTDGKGLFLLVQKTGSKYWRLKYYFNKKEKLLALGVYPEVTLAEARIKCDEARKLLAKEIDPCVAKQIHKQTKHIMAANSFEAIAREWFAKFSPRWSSEEHKVRILNRLEKNIFPWLGQRPINELTAPEILAILRKIEERGAIETAHRAKQTCGQIIRYAIATGRADRDPTSDLKGAIPPPETRHLAAIVDPKQVGELLRSIQSYQGHYVTKCALMLAPLLMVRPGELRFAEWAEMNFESAEWRIPSNKMKMKITHIVPLATQAISIFKELRALTGDGKYVFPSVQCHTRPMSDNTVLGALRRLGYTKEEMTGHGFRSMASTLLNEQGWNRDAIERQLAHSEKNKVRAAYNYAEYLPERRKMMQHWADYLDQLTENK